MFKLDRQHLMMTSFDDYLAHMEADRLAFQKRNLISDKDYYLTRRVFLDKLTNKRALFQRFLNRQAPIKLTLDDQKTLFLKRSVDPTVIRNIHGEQHYIQTQLNRLRTAQHTPRI